MNRLWRGSTMPLTAESGDIIRRWGDGMAVPLLWMAVGLPCVWRTATTPFEEFQGMLTVVGFSLLWTVWADVVRRPKTDAVRS